MQKHAAGAAAAQQCHAVTMTSDPSSVRSLQLVGLYIAAGGAGVAAAAAGGFVFPSIVLHACRTFQVYFKKSTYYKYLLLIGIIIIIHVPGITIIVSACLILYFISEGCMTVTSE